MRLRTLAPLVLLTYTLAPVFAAPVPKPATINPEVVAAFKMLGGEYGSMKSTDRWLPPRADPKAPFHETATFSDGRSQFVDAEDRSAPGIPAFRFRKIPTGDLPAVNVPFGLDLHDSGCTDADVEVLGDLKNLARLNLLGTEVTENALKHLGANPTLHSLTLGEGRHARGRFAGWQGFTSLKHVTRLSLSRTNLTGDGWRELKEMPELDTLNFHGSEVTDTELSQLEGVKHLATLGLGSTQVTDKGVEKLKGFANLSSLDLSSVKKATGAGIEGLANLVTLDLLGTRVTDARIREWKGLKKLATLSLGSTGVTDALVGDFADFKALTLLDLEYSGVTNEGGAKLTRALSKCKILYVYTR